MISKHNWQNEAILAAIQTAVLAAAPEKKEPKNLHLTHDNGSFMGNYCDTCKIFTFDKDTFEETGAWCLCYPFNQAIDQYTTALQQLFESEG